MNKFLLATAILCIGSFAANAQTDTTSAARQRLDEIESKADEIVTKRHQSKSNSIIQLKGVTHLYVGGLIVPDEQFPRSKSHEVGLNILQLSINAAEWLSLDLGCDLKWDRFISKQTMYEIDKNGQFAISAATPPNRIKSKICAFGFSAPANISINIGKVGLKFGAEALYDLDRCNKVKNKFRDANGKRDKQILEGGEIQNFRLSYFGVLSFEDLGIYFKYCPGTIIPGSINLQNLVSIGVFFGL